MDLLAIAHVFDKFRKTAVDSLRAGREQMNEKFNSSGLGKFSRYKHMSLDQFRSALKVLLGEEISEYLTRGQVQAILEHLDRGLDIKAIPALIIVDVQNDFISGSLALKTCPAGQDGAEVVPMINDLLSKRLFPHVAYTKDWHPADHISFIDNVMNFPVHPSSRLAAQHAKVFDTVTFDIGRKVEQKLWPRHCQVDTPGAELHKDLTPPSAGDIVITKGTQSNADSYSGFWDNNDQHHSALFRKLVDEGVTHVFVCGIALDICVADTAVDAHEHGFKTFVIEDACRGVSNEGIDRSIKLFNQRGMSVIRASEVETKLKEIKGMAS